MYSKESKLNQQNSDDSLSQAADFIPGEDEQIMLRYQQGDVAGMEGLVNRYINIVYGLCLKWSKDVSVADDLA